MQVNDRVKAILPCDGKNSIQYERGKIIYIGRRALVQFDTNICGHNGNGIGEERKCWMCNLELLEVS
jgi:hypothetical protein